MGQVAMTEVNSAVKAAFDYLDKQGEDIPTDVWQAAVKARVFAVKADGDLAGISATYNNEIVSSLTTYFEGGNVTTPRNQFKRAMVEAFGAAFDLGWADGGGEGVPDSDALAWFNARVDQEFGYIEMLFVEAKELRRDTEFDSFAWTTQRADGYTRTLREIYNAGFLRATKDQMVTFEGDDGEKPCDTCKKLKGARHKISWFVKRNYIPPHGTGLDCAKGGHCRHYLVNDKGERMTV